MKDKKLDVTINQIFECTLGHVCLFAYTNLFTHESVYSSLSLLNEFLWYDKLWGPSQRVVTLFSFFRDMHQSKR